MANDDTYDGGTELDLVPLLFDLYEAGQWQLRIRGCFSPRECATSMVNDWTFEGRPVAKGRFIILKDKIIVFIPEAINPQDVLQSLVSYRARGWKRDCLSCRTGTCALVEDFQDEEESRVGACHGVGAVDPREARIQKLLVEEVFKQIKDNKHREAFYLHYFEGRSHAEIAALFNVNPSTVRKWFSRELGRLQAIFVPSLEPLA